MNKMIKLLVVGATVVTFAANVNAMEDRYVNELDTMSLKEMENNQFIQPKELKVQALTPAQKNYRKKRRQEIAQAPVKRRNAIIKKIVGATLVTGTAVALAADYYFNNGENTKNYVIEPAKTLISKIATSNVVSKIGGWFSSAWNKMPAMRTLFSK